MCASSAKFSIRDVAPIDPRRVALSRCAVRPPSSAWNEPPDHPLNFFSRCAGAGVKAPLGAGYAFARGARRKRPNVCAEGAPGRAGARSARLRPAAREQGGAVPVFGVQEDSAEELCVRRPCAAARAVRRCGHGCAGTCTPVQPLSCTTSTSGPPCVQNSSRAFWRGAKLRVGSAVFSMVNACSSVERVTFF